MNDGHKAVLKRYNQRLSEDIMVTEVLLGELYQEGIFEKSMIEIIRSERTNTDKVQKLLDLLPKRGPNAFEKFTKVLEKDYQWLATSLASAPTVKSLQGASDGASKLNGETHNRKTRDSNHAYHHHHHHDFNSMDSVVDTDIKKLVAAYIHKQFGQSKRVSEKDKKSLEKFMGNQIQRERTRYQSLMSPSLCSTPCRDMDSTSDDVFHSTDIQDHLFKIHMKMEQYVSSDNNITTTNSSSHPDKLDDNARAILYQTKLMPEDMDFILIGKEVDALILQRKVLEDEISACLERFDERLHKQPLASLIDSLLDKCRQQEQEMAQDNQQISHMLTEIENYSSHIERLEKERVELRKQIQAAYMDMASLRQEKASLTEKVHKLEDKVAQAEREKTRDTNLLRLGLSVSTKAQRSTPRGLGNLNLGHTYPQGSTNASSTGEDVQVSNALRRSATRSSQVRLSGSGYPTFSRKYPPTVRYMSAAKKKTTGKDGGGGNSSSKY